MRRTKICYCPQCGSSFLLITEQKIYCLSCRLMFNRKVLNSVLPNDLCTKREFKTKKTTHTWITKEKELSTK